MEAFNACSNLSRQPLEELYTMNDLLDEVMLYLVTASFYTSTWLAVRR